MISAPPLNRKKLYLWTRDILRKYKIRPRKKYSQNFIINPQLILDILKRVKPKASTIEIGAGIGTISYFLSRKIKNVTLFIEIDEKLSVIVEQLINPPHIVTIGNALELDWRFEQVISNTPYHITSDILIKLVRSNMVKYSILVLQKDVVNRLIAKPGTKEYGRITVITNTVFKIEPGPIYSAYSFFPAPEVSSRLVMLSRIREYDPFLVSLEELTRRLFCKRRRKADKVLREEYGLTEEDLIKLGIKPDKRVYELSIGELLRLTEYVKNLE